MAAEGVRLVAATPHVRDDYPTTATTMEAALEQVHRAVADAGVDIEVRGGGEIALDRLDCITPDELARFGLGGNECLVLLEYPYYGRPSSLATDCAALADRGVVPVIAHPERNQTVQERPADLAGLVGAGAVVQLTAGSVDGSMGRAAAACSRALIDLGLAHLIASDTHAPGHHRAGMASAVDALGRTALSTWLSCDVPDALLAGAPLPPRPVDSRRRRFSRLRR